MLPSKNTVRLFNLTVELINQDTTGFEQWRELIDVGAALNTTIQTKPLKSYMHVEPLRITSLEVVFSCWSWQRVAQVVETLPPLEDMFFENLSQMEDSTHLNCMSDALCKPFSAWQQEARRGLQRMPYGEWGIWETLMYRPWHDCEAQSLVQVMQALKKLPRITNQSTLDNLAEVSTIGNSTTLNIGGMMALMVGTDPALHSSEAHQKLLHLTTNDGALIENWTKVQDAYNCIQRDTILHEVQPNGRDVTRKM